MAPSSILPGDVPTIEHVPTVLPLLGLATLPANQMADQTAAGLVAPIGQAHSCIPFHCHPEGHWFRQPL